MKPITSPDGYREWWTHWTWTAFAGAAGLLVIFALVLALLFYWLGPIVIARGLARWKGM